ncbi:class I SAM-dependent methyltransferase [Neptunomonas antarctica]|uniref:Lysine methyltransferase n=1 Tax=Neptunomonas antarctica TaxID=619304 RepID=A0A1N7KHY3_9GAMM|nr:methyltransferase domain-containing protein [Neptunomonas antarctica]SIS61195.1 Lysine methyltransferase [Neptunomonas antarctica]
MSALRLSYQTIEFGEVDIHVRTLRDNQQFLDVGGVAEILGISSAAWPLFGIIWPSGEVLAHFMFDYEIEGKRILEVGCGIGLTSLMLNHRHANITATDYHPEVGDFLKVNIALNNGKVIPFVRTGWADVYSGLGVFDVIVGSDLLYEKEHVELLSDFIDRHAKPHCEVILVDPGRGHHSRFSKRMLTLGYAHNQHKPENTDYLDKPFSGQILRYLR